MSRYERTPKAQLIDELEALREAEEAHRDLLENLPVAVVVHGADTSILSCNRLAHELLGLEEDDATGRIAEDPRWVFYREDGTRMPVEEFPVVQVANTLEPLREYVTGVAHPNSEEVTWVLVDALPKFDEENALRTITVTFRDITQQKLATEKLRERDHIIRSSSSAIATADMDGKVTYVNPAFLKEWGFEDDSEVLGRPFPEFSVVEDRLDEIMEALQREGRWSGEIEARKGDGSLFDVQVSAATVFDSQGNPIALTSTSMDVTDRRRAEEEVRRLALAVKHCGELINLATLDGRMIFLNAAGSRILGIDPDEVEQVGIMEVIPDHLTELVTGELLPTLMRGEEWKGDLQYRNRKTGDLTDVRSTTFTVKDPATGDPIFLANVSRDITERKRIEREREELIGQLREALEHVKTLSGILPICAKCKKIRDDEGYWQQVEVYVRDHTEAEFSHSLCGECMTELFPEESAELPGPGEDG